MIYLIKLDYIITYAIYQFFAMAIIQRKLKTPRIEDLSFFDNCYKTWKFEEIESLLGVYKDNINITNIII